MAAMGRLESRRVDGVWLLRVLLSVALLRVIHAESCDNLSPLGNVPAVVVYQAC